MDTANVSAAAAPRPGPPTAAETREEPNDSTVITSDFETFLTLLTAQLENQDPLNPLESTDFATQLATFSGVEQQVQTNELLQGLSDALGATGVSQLSDWVGRDVRAAMPVMFDGSPVTLAPAPAAGADEMALIVRDASGSVVQRSVIPASSETLTWAGVTTDGGPFPPGLYSFSLESRAGGEAMATDPVEVYATVREARLDGGEVELVFDGAATVAANAVSAVRQQPGSVGGI